MVRMCKSNIFFPVSIVCPSVRHAISSITTKQNLTKLATSLPLIIRVCESNITYPCVHGPSICPSCYLLLNHLAEFNQTCYITGPHAWGMREQDYFWCICLFMCLSSVHLFVMLSPPKPLGWIQPNLLPLMIRVCESNIFSCALVICLSVHHAVSS